MTKTTMTTTVMVVITLIDNYDGDDNCGNDVDGDYDDNVGGVDTVIVVPAMTMLSLLMVVIISLSFYFSLP